MLSWNSSAKAQSASWSPQTCLQEVLTCSRLVLSSTMSYPTRRKTTSTESAEPVVSARKVPQSTLSFPRTPLSSKKSRSITILKSMKCQMTWRNSEQQELLTDLQIKAVSDGWNCTFTARKCLHFTTWQQNNCVLRHPANDAKSSRSFLVKYSRHFFLNISYVFLYGFWGFQVLG